MDLLHDRPTLAEHASSGNPEIVEGGGMSEFTEERFNYTGVPTAQLGAELIVMVGISGSGKSVVARSMVMKGRGEVVRLNRDNLRSMMYGEVPWSAHKDEVIRVVEKEMARVALKKGRTVVIDDTNCVRRTRTAWQELARELRIRLRIVTMTTPLEVCVERDAARAGKECVGKEVILRQLGDLNKFKMAAETKTEVLTRPVFERQALLSGDFPARLLGSKWVLVDVDGTVADHAGLRGPFEEHKVLLDEVYPVVVDWVRAIYQSYNVCVVSGRHDFCGDDTCEWFEGHQIPFDHILMRRTGDNRPDTIIKQEILEELSEVIGKENIAFVLDDRPCVVRSWRENGITVYPVRGTSDHSLTCPQDAPSNQTCPHCGALGDF